MSAILSVRDLEKTFGSVVAANASTIQKIARLRIAPCGRQPRKLPAWTWKPSVEPSVSVFTRMPYRIIDIARLSIAKKMSR